MDEVRHIVSAENPHIVGIAEVKPKNSRYLPTLPELQIPNYKVLERNIEQQTGRGCPSYPIKSQRKQTIPRKYLTKNNSS